MESDALEAVLRSHEPDSIVMDVEGTEVELLSDTNLEGVRGLIIELQPHIVGREKIDVLVADLNSIGFETEARQGKTYVFLRDISKISACSR
ncbi:MAG: hypothetical protein GY742_17385 [Hyphomicrobiales bacterium]|nr:hypothetical protein [Hyphomicrobiales bacterium]